MNIAVKQNKPLDMSNIFKTNSRFSSLIDDIPDKKKKENPSSENKGDRFNSFKSEKNENSRFRPNDDKQRERNRQEREERLKLKKEFEEQEKERKKMELLSMNNFPDLFGNINQEEDKKEIVQTNSYTEKLMKKNVDVVEKKIDPDLVNLKPGWILLKKDKMNNKIIRKIQPETVYKEEKEEKEEKDIGIEIVNALVELHERRTNEFIEFNGYETWEKMFKSPNWQDEENYSDSDTEIEEDENDDADWTYY